MNISITDIEKFVFPKLDDMNAFHTRQCREIGAILAEKEHADKTVVDVALMFHDIGRCRPYKGAAHDHGEASARIAAKFMYDKHYPGEFAGKVLHCITAHSTPRRRHVNHPLASAAPMPETKEAKVVYDADMIQALSSFGLVKHLRRNAGLPWRDMVADAKLSFEAKYKTLQTRSGKRTAKPRYEKVKEFLGGLQ